MPRAHRILSWIVAVAALAAPADAQTITTSAPFAILVDADSGSVLFEKNADELMSPASMVKVMTAELVTPAPTVACALTASADPRFEQFPS